jgi:threonylcarbamoyladenosine tRNA methylthiotransferase MtaB
MDLRVVTFGCRINGYEAELIKETLSADERLGRENGLMVIINSCTVTAEADRQCRQLIRKVRKENPDAFIVATGCGVQTSPESYAKMPEVDRVLGNRDKLKIENYYKDSADFAVSDILDSEGKPFSQNLIHDFEGRNKAYLQIQQGCRHKCTYCIVPSARGINHSCSPDRIFKETERLLASGFKELTLAGIDIASYGKDQAEYGSIASLIHNLLSSFKEIKRLRLSSFDPAEVTDDLIECFRTEERLMPHLHLSLQAGDDLTLKRMGRRHSRQDVKDLCNKLRNARPDIVFGADIITGFPTETEEMFENTLNLVKECNLLLLHIFPYSVRNGTPAAKMPQIPVPVRKERAKILRQEGDNLLISFLSSTIGQVKTVLTEKNNMGRCENYIPVKIIGKSTETEPEGKIVKVKITGAENGCYLGERIE